MEGGGWTVTETSNKNLAVQYIRISAKTLDHRYSFANQFAVIGAFARAHSLVIIKTYLDNETGGHPGGSRPAQTRLITDIEEGRTHISSVLLYDIGRFGHQCPSESYTRLESACQNMGIKIDHCGPGSSFPSNFAEKAAQFIKRSMEIELLREARSRMKYFFSTPYERPCLACGNPALRDG